MSSLRLKIDRPVLNIPGLEVPTHSSFDSSYSVIVRSSRASTVFTITSGVCPIIDILQNSVSLKQDK